MVPSFKQYLVEEQREVFFTFGRMNPPTIGHGKLLSVLATKAGKNPYKVYLSVSSDPKKNPLAYEAKVKHVRKMFPKHGRNIALDKNIRTVFDVAVSLFDQGFNKVTMVVGSDRVTEFKTLLEKYNGEKARHGFYNFEKISVVSAGERDPDAEGVEGMSASKQRENAKNNDFTTFSQGVPSTMSARDAKRLFNDVRAGMGLKETLMFRNHISLESVSEAREDYVKGVLFNLHDKVTIKESGKTGRISVLGTNYVIVALDEGETSRQWIDSIELTEMSNSQIVAKIKSKTISKKRYDAALKILKDIWSRKKNNASKTLGYYAANIAKQYDVDARTLMGMIEGNQPEWGTPEATKKAKKFVPGQNEAKDDEVALARNVIDRELQSDKVKHDRILDRARLNRARRKNKQTNPKV